MTEDEEEAVEKRFHVYMLASRRNGTLYVGVTAGLTQRVWLHREGIGSEFTAKYGVTQLVWFEEFATAAEAIAFEKRIKRWRRAWKLELIETMNPTWADLFPSLL